MNLVLGLGGRPDLARLAGATTNRYSARYCERPRHASLFRVQASILAHDVRSDAASGRFLSVVRAGSVVSQWWRPCRFQCLPLMRGVSDDDHN